MPRGFHANSAAGTLSVVLRTPAPPEGEPRGTTATNLSARFGVNAATPSVFGAGGVVQAKEHFAAFG